MNTRQEKIDWLIDNLYTIPVRDNPRKLYACMSDEELEACIQVAKKDLEGNLSRAVLQQFLDIIAKYNSGSIVVSECHDDPQ